MPAIVWSEVRKPGFIKPEISREPCPWTLQRLHLCASGKGIFWNQTSYLYFTFCKIFIPALISVFFTEVWVTDSFLGSPGLSLIFWVTSTQLLSGGSRSFRSSTNTFPISLVLFQGLHLWLVSSSYSCSAMPQEGVVYLWWSGNHVEIWSLIK